MNVKRFHQLLFSMALRTRLLLRFNSYCKCLCEDYFCENTLIIEWYLIYDLCMVIYNLGIASINVLIAIHYMKNYTVPSEGEMTDKVWCITKNKCAHFTDWLILDDKRALHCWRTARLYWLYRLGSYDGMKGCDYMM